MCDGDVAVGAILVAVRRLEQTVQRAPMGIRDGDEVRLTPVSLAATAVGAAAGGLLGKFARKRVQAGIGDKMDEALPPGSAGVIAIYGAPVLAILIALALAVQGARMRSLGARLMRWADAALVPRLRLPKPRLPKLRRA